MPNTKRAHSDDLDSLDDADSEPSSDADCSRTGRSRRRRHSHAKKEGKRRLPAVCQVKGCQADLFAIGKRYCLRKRVCPDHLVARQVELADSDYPGIHRFCHQCGKFEPADSFDEGKRSCRARLLKRRFNQQANRLAKKQRQATVLGRTGAPLRSRAATRPHVQQLIEAEAQQWPQLMTAGPGAPQAASDLDPRLLQRLSSTSSSWTSGSMEQLQAADDGAAACGLALPDGLVATGALQLQLEAAATAAGGGAPTAADAAAAVAAAAGLLPFCALAAEPTMEELQFEDELEQLICCQLASVSSGQQQQQEGPGRAMPMPAAPEAALAKPAAAAAAAAEGPESPAGEEDPAVAAAAQEQPASPGGTHTPSASSSGHGCSSGSEGSPLSHGQGSPRPGVAATAEAPPGSRAHSPVATVPLSLRSGGSSSRDGARSTATVVDAGALAGSISAMLEPSASAVRWPSAEKQALLKQLMELMYEDATSPGAPVGAAVAAAAATPWAPGGSGGLPSLPDPILPDLATFEQAAGMGCLLGRQSSGLAAGARSSIASPDASAAAAVAAALGSSAGSASAGVAAMLHPAACPPAFRPGHGRYVVQMMPVLAPVEEGSAGLSHAAAAWPAATTPLPVSLSAVPAASAGLPPASVSSAGLAQRRRDPAGSQRWHSASAGSSDFSGGDRAPAAVGGPQLLHLRRLGVLHRQFCDVSSRLAQLESLVTAETQAAVAAAAAGLSAPPTPTASSPQQLLSAASSAASTEFALHLLQSQAQGGVAGGTGPAPPMWL